MLSQTKNKRGISIMIGYVLLITVAVVMGILVYNWIKTYVPREALECPDEVSIFIEKAIYDEGNSILNVTIKNNGNFNIAGYFIHATNSSGQELATIDLSNYTLAGQGKGGTVLFSTENSLEPNEKRKDIFDLSSAGIGQIYSVEIIPVRFQEEENKLRFVSCGNSRVRENVDYWEECVADCSGLECGTDPVCGEICGTCEEGYVCNSTGQCVPQEECTDTCASLGYVCGTWTICGVSETCPPGCELDYNCVLGQCILSCGNGELDSGEGCDDGNTEDGDGCSSTCQIETNWTCSGEPSVCSYCNSNLICETLFSEDCTCPDCEGTKDGCEEGYVCEDGSCVQMPPVNSCKSYCAYLGYNGTASGCRNNCGGACSGICEPYSESEYCTSPQSYCCCVPLA